MQRQRNSWLAAVCVFAAIAATFRAEAAKPEAQTPPDANFSEIAKMCTHRQGESAVLIQAGQSAADAMAKLAAAVKSRAASGTAGNTASAPPAAIAASVEAASASAATFLNFASAARANAAATIARAQSASNPAEQVVLYRQAMAQQDQAELFARRAISDLAPPGSSGSGNGGAEGGDIHSAGHFQEGLAIQQARALADGKGDLATAAAIYDGAAKHADAALKIQRGTNFFSVVKYDANSGMATLRNGTVVDLSALNAAQPGGQPKPLFKDMRMLDGTTVPIPDVDARNDIMARSGAAEKVGGVAFDVTLAVLQATGQPEFQSTAPMIGADHVMLISLKRLLAAVQNYSASPAQWATLPDTLRHPANIGRIRGFTLAPNGQDVWLIGTVSARPETRIDIDTIILALRTAWLQDTVPGVSLDRSPYDPNGPNVPRVIGLPADSSMAKTMLAADYEMKSIVLGIRPTGVADYRSAMTLIAEQGQAPPQLATRFWYHPKPLDAGAVRQSSSGRTTVFNAELQVLSQGMQADGADFVSTSGGNDIGDRAAKAYTAALDAFARSRAADPGFLIARLDGLLDAVAAARLLRLTGANSPVLRAFAKLPYRPFGRPAQPSDFPALTNSVDVRDSQGTTVPFSIVGGVSFDLRAPRASLGQNNYSLLDQIEARIANAKGGNFALDVAAPLRLVGAPEASPFDADVAQGAASFFAADFASASASFRNAVSADPASGEARAWLAYALLWSGQKVRALAQAHTAALLEPGNTIVASLVYDVQRRLGGRPQVLGSETQIRQHLAAFYIGLGTAARDQAGRKRWLGEAAALLPSDPYVLIRRAQFSMDSGTMQAALGDFGRALAVLNKGGRAAAVFSQPARTLYADALIGQAIVLQGLASDRIAKAYDRNETLSIQQRMAILDGADDLVERGLKSIDQAQHHDPSALAVGMELALYLDRYAIAKPVMSETERAQFIDALRNIATNGIRQFPKNDEVYGARALMLFTIGDQDAALQDVDHALSVNPKNPDSIALRIRIQAVLGNCDRARADVNRLKAGARPGDSWILFFEKRCGPI